MDRQVNKARSRWLSGCFTIAGLFVVVLIGIAILMPRFSTLPRRRSPDGDVKSNLKNVATAQEAYFVDHETYTSNIDSLKGYGYNQSYDVTMTASVTETTFIITGIATKRCKPDPGACTSNSTTGTLTGTRCR